MLSGLRKQRDGKCDVFETLPRMGLRSDVFRHLEIRVITLGNDGERTFGNRYGFRLQLVDGTSNVVSR